MFSVGCIFIRGIFILELEGKNDFLFVFSKRKKAKIMINVF